MISKLAKAHESWGSKIIFAAVAVSFVSLFGVTGYITSANQNQTLIKVGNKKITQSEFSYRQQKELSALRNLIGDSLDLTDEMRNSLNETIIKQIIDETVLDLTMDKYGIHFPMVYVQQVVFAQPEFLNPSTGKFDPDAFRQALSRAGVSEEEYLAEVKREMARKMLVSDVLKGISVPSVLSRAVHKMDNQRKIFKYVTLTPDDVKIERQISEDEIKQYFEDFSEQFMVPETRDANILYIPNSLIINKYVASDDLINEYFSEHKSEFDEPEKREVLQMVFTDKALAEKAFAAVKNGDDFALTAKDLKAENADEPTLGVVAQDELAEELADIAFELETNTPQLVQVADSWQVISIKEVIPAKTADFATAKKEITEQLVNENLYDALHDVRADIDDAVNGGKTLVEVSDMFNLKPLKVSGISEGELITNLPESLKDLGTTLDVNELAFSYGTEEISSAEEFDNGIVVMQVTAIKDAHLPEVAEVKDKIVELWTVQEKNALAKEIAENIANEIAEGSDLSVVARARELEVFRSEPISRNESFADLSKAEISDLFLAEDGASKLYEHTDNSYVIATPVETVSYQDKLDEKALKRVKNKTEKSLLKDMEKSALASFAEDYKIKIDYDLAGFSE